MEMTDRRKQAIAPAYSRSQVRPTNRVGRTELMDRFHQSLRATVLVADAVGQGSVAPLADESGKTMRRRSRVSNRPLRERRVLDPDNAALTAAVNSVLPGPVMTGRRRSYLKHWASLHDMTEEAATLKFPQKAEIARYCEPKEIAELIAFLVSPGARSMTGSTLRMDSGGVKSV